jgi:hypothetical protein
LSGQDARSAAQGHYGHMESYPPYVGGDDDEIDGWQATCMCGWAGVQTPSVSRAHIELIEHLNGALRGCDG